MQNKCAAKKPPCRRSKAGFADLILGGDYGTVIFLGGLGLVDVRELGEISKLRGLGVFAVRREKLKFTKRNEMQV